MKGFATLFLFAYLIISIKIFSQGGGLNSKFQFSKEAIVIQLSENVYAGILPEMELLSGVLTQTSWIKKMGPLGKGNDYYQRLKSFFEKYEDHPAIEIAQDLTDDGFAYDAPPGFVLQLGPLPELKMDSVPQYFINRAGGIEKLEEFRSALKNLSEESNFLNYFLTETDYLKEIIDSTIKGFDATRITNWLNDFFGYKGDEFHVIFAPAMFPGGGYGASKIIGNNKIVFQVIRGESLSQDKPFFCTPQSLVELTFHEFGHSFINPAFEAKNDLMEELGLVDLFNPVESKMRKMAYGSFEIFFNELHVRAMTIIAMEDYLESPSDTRKLQDIEKGQGFYLIDFTYNKLKEYRDSRNLYPDFKVYLPDLINSYSKYKNGLIELAE